MSHVIDGSPAALLTNTSIIVILVLQLFMCVRLFIHRRRKVYIWLLVSLLVLVAYYSTSILSLTTHSFSVSASSLQILHVFAFIMINRAIFQLYHSSNRRDHATFILFMTIAGLIALAQSLAPEWLDAPEEQLSVLQTIGLDVFVILLVFIYYAGFAYKVGQTKMYRFGLIVFFVGHLAYLINQYMLAEPIGTIRMLELCLPVLYIFSLFMLIFERTVELLDASYQTAITDGLTGLYNRRYIVSKANQYIREGYPLALLFSDIDNFKKLNDTLGHDAGDEALKAVAKILQDEGDPVGFAGRFGGEEMVILITDDKLDLAKFCETVRARIEKEAKVTVSIGYSKLQDGVSAEQLITQADKAMYRAKTTGKNRVVKYTKAVG